jgi:hypothetical protein
LPDYTHRFLTLFSNSMVSYTTSPVRPRYMERPTAGFYVSKPFAGLAQHLTIDLHIHNKFFPCFDKPGRHHAGKAPELTDKMSLIGKTGFVGDVGEIGLV